MSGWRGILNPDDEPKPFLEHLEEFRFTLFRCLIALALGMAVAAPLTPLTLGLLKAPLVGMVEDPDRFLRSLAVAGAFSTIIRITFWSGLILSAPFLVLFLGQFIFPGLTQLERRHLAAAGGGSGVLFLLGVALGYSITLPVALRVMMRLHDWLGIQAEWTVTSYVAFTVHLLIGFGLAFQLPVVVLLLGSLGILDVEQLKSKRRHVFLGLLVLAMLLTPPDVITQLIMAVPLYGLYEVSIWILWWAERRRGRG